MPRGALAGAMITGLPSPASPLDAPLDDETLARRSAAGDRRALEELLERHADRVHALCRRIVSDRDDALDAAQEAMIAVARGIERFDGRSAFTTWLYRVATNAALDELRRHGRRPRPTADMREVAAPGGGVDDLVADRIDVDAALATLPEEFRVAVVLRDLTDLDYAEISEILGVPGGTVRSRIARGRAALLATLGNFDDASQRPTTMSRPITNPETRAPSDALQSGVPPSDRGPR